MRIVANLVSSTVTAPIGALAAMTIYFGLLAAQGEPAVPPAPPAPDLPSAG